MFLVRFADGRRREIWKHVDVFAQMRHNSAVNRPWVGNRRVRRTVDVRRTGFQRSAMAASGGVRAARTPGQRAASTPTTAELIRTSTS
ncbi:hypothetical protein NG2371_04495 [Nocardia gamkensis]|nr:hypothetical protein [Nocardia gamkensis]